MKDLLTGRDTLPDAASAAGALFAGVVPVALANATKARFCPKT